MKRQLLPLFFLIFSSAVFAQVGLPDFTYQGGGSAVGPNPANLDNAPNIGVNDRLSSVTLGDLNGDGLLDFLSGNQGHRRPEYFENTGTATVPSWTATAMMSIDTISISPVSTNQMKPILEDIDNDGDLDMFLSARYDYTDISGGFSLNDILFFENVGTSTVPEFTFSPDELPGLVYQQVATFGGIGFVDIDNDMDKDLVTIGSDSIAFFLNVGTLTEPAFERKVQAENPFDDFDGTGVAYGSMLYATPVFYDLDEDGDYDLYFGNDSGDLVFAENIGTATVPEFNTSTHPLVITALPEVGQFASLAIKDVDDDGVLDIVGGQFNPGIYYWYKGSYPLAMESAVKDNETQITLSFNVNVQTNGTNPTDFTVTDGLGTTFAVTAQADGTAGDKEIVLTVADITSAMNGLTVTYANSNNEISDLSGGFLPSDLTGVAVGGASTTTFTGGSWDNGTPNLSYVAIVDQDYTSTADLVFHSLTINPGKNFTLDGHKATVTTDLVLENGAGFMDNGTLDVSGDIIVKRATNTEATSDFHLMSSPISNGDAEDIYQSSYAYRYVGGEYNNVYSFDNGVKLVNGEGLAISGTGTGGITRSFNGTLNSGSITYDLISTDEWHLLGNPYPTQMSLSAFHTANNTVLKPTMYFYNEDTGAYDTWNVSLASGTGAATANAAVIQGFFVEELNTSAAQVNYTPAMRVFATDAFLRNGMEDNSGQVKLAFGNAETLLAWNADASNETDVNDATYLQGSSLQGLYTLQEDNKLTIQSIHNDFASVVVPVGYYNYEAGLREISLKDVKVNGVLEVILIDRYQNTTHNLNDGSYEFMVEASEVMVTDRFELVLAKTSLSVHDAETSGVVVTGGASLRVFSGLNNSIEKVGVYSIAGKLIHQEVNINSDVYQWEARTAEGLYMIEVITANGTSNHKIVIK